MLDSFKGGLPALAGVGYKPQHFNDILANAAPVGPNGRSRCGMGGLPMRVGMVVGFALFLTPLCLLVLYYTVNTVLTIAQQWNINRRLEASASGRN